MNNEVKHDILMKAGYEKLSKGTLYQDLDVYAKKGSEHLLVKMLNGQKVILNWMERKALKKMLEDKC